MKAPNDEPTNLDERQWLQVRTKAFKEWFGDWEKFSKLENSFKQFKNKYNGRKYESTDDFRRVQEESRRLDKENLSKLHGEIDSFDNFKRELSIVYERLLTRGNGTGFNSRVNLKYTDSRTSKTNTFSIGEVNPELFHSTRRNGIIHFFLEKVYFCHLKMF